MPRKGEKTALKDHDVDRYLVLEAQQGDKEAFDILAMKYRPKLMHLLNRYVDDPNEVLDLTQETFIHAYKAIHSFRGDSAFYTWLYRIAINLAKNYLKLMQHRVPNIDIDIDSINNGFTDTHLEENKTPENIFMSNEMENALMKIFMKLPKDLRTCIMLREIAGLSYEQIAKKLSCPVGTVRSRLSRAREMIEFEMKKLEQ